MPSGRTHTAINLTVLAAGSALASAAALPLPGRGDIAAFVVAFVVGTFLITPDLDLANGRVDARKHWGPLGWIWIPFGVMSRHRGLNHTYFIGPLLRVLYLGLVACAAYAAVTGVWPAAADWQPPPVATTTLACATAGYWVSQALHLIADGIHPFTPLTTRETK